MMSTNTPAGLPAFCYTVAPLTGGCAKIIRGDSCLYGVRLREPIERANAALGVDRRTEAAMLGGATFGWSTPAAKPENYDDQGLYVGPEMEVQNG